MYFPLIFGFQIIPAFAIETIPCYLNLGFLFHYSVGECTFIYTDIFLRVSLTFSDDYSRSFTAVVLYVLSLYNYTFIIYFGRVVFETELNLANPVYHKFTVMMER